MRQLPNYAIVLRVKGLARPHPLESLALILYTILVLLVLLLVVCPPCLDQRFSHRDTNP
jgi:hypothetical protein